MDEKRYIISEAAEKTGIESHVLRYWEDELGLNIPRNEMGHRYYTDKQLQLFKQIKELKDSGLQLKAVKTVLDPIVAETDEEGRVSVLPHNEPVEADASDKLSKFEQIIGDIVTRSLIENNERLGLSISGKVSDKVIKEMDYMMRVKEEAEEERYRKFDETVRGMLKSGKEAAAYREKVVKKKHRAFGFGRKKNNT